MIGNSQACPSVSVLSLSGGWTFGMRNGLCAKNKWGILGTGDCLWFTDAVTQQDYVTQDENAVPPSLFALCVRIFGHCPIAISTADSNSADEFSFANSNEADECWIRHRSRVNNRVDRARAGDTVPD
jgi:hypothetical protein